MRSLVIGNRIVKADASRGRRGAHVLALMVVPIALAYIAAAEGQRGRPGGNSRGEGRPAQHAPPSPAHRQEMRVPFTVGETLDYDVSWSSYLTAGTATLSVREKKPSYNSVAYYVVAEGRPTPLLSNLYDLYYRADSLLDVYTLLPQRGSIFSKEGRHQRNRITMYDQTKHRAMYEVLTQTDVKKDLAIPAEAQDALGAVYLLRALRLKAGDRFAIPICDNGESFKVQISVAAPEPVKTGMGEMKAWRIMPTVPAQNAQARRLMLWISDDERRLPVKLEAQLAVGTFDLILRAYTRSS